MNARFLFINLLFLFIGVQIGYSQTTKPLSESVAAIAARYNQTLFGKNTFVPTIDSTNTWAVSQAAPLRRVSIKGNLKLFEGASSGINLVNL
ncbi:MAG: hypothetical protein Q8N05_09265 [Bacteroidota bacterium]|nr:hypothetical protein [Bacteroidota bacterium]